MNIRSKKVKLVLICFLVMLGTQMLVPLTSFADISDVDRTLIEKSLGVVKENKVVKESREHFI